MADDSVELLAGFSVNQSNANEELLAEAEIRHESSEDLLALLTVRQASSQDLFAYLASRHSGSQDLPALLETRHTSSENLGAALTARQAASRNHLGVLVTRHKTSQDLLALSEIRRSASLDYPATATVRHSSSRDTLAGFTARHQSSVDHLGEAVIRHSAETDHSAELIVRHSADTVLLAEFIVRHSASVDLLSETVVRHSADIDYKARFAVRHAYPLWTNRRYINGVVDESEELIGDADLELVIEGVMDDIKVWCSKEGISYTSWEDIDTVPLAIKRATTYGVVAALFARRTKTFRNRVIPSVNPVSITVAGEEKEAMNHWQDKSMEMLEAYLSTDGPARIWVSTADLEPIFRADVDIPAGQGKRETMSYNEWIEDYAYPEDVEE